MAARMASDKSPAVRREVALTLRDVPADQSVPLLVKIAKQFDGKDRAYLEAFGMGSEARKTKFTPLSTLGDMGGAPEKWSDAFADRVAFVSGRSRGRVQIARSVRETQQ